MKTKIILTGIITLLLALHFISAISVDIEVNPTFNTGDKISFSYTILSETAENIEYTSYVSCPSAPQAPLIIKNAALEPNVPFTETHTYMSKVAEYVESQECRAVVWIEKPEQVSKEEYFNIETKPSFDLNILTCKDVDCNETTKVFVKGESIYINYDSEISTLLIITTLTYPDGTSQQLTIPTSIKAEQVGTYSLEVSASKQGYRTMTESIQFGVIEEEPNIPYTSVSEIGKSEFSIKDLFRENLSLFIIIAIGVVIIIGSIIIFIALKKLREKPVQE